MNFITISKSKYNNNIIPTYLLQNSNKNYSNIPKLIKICINTGLGLKAQSYNFFEKSFYDIIKISSQYPKLTIARKSLSLFKIRAGITIGLAITLRKEKMYSFLEKLAILVLPKIKNFYGLNRTSFDKYGNYNFGIKDHLIFPEIEFFSIEDKRGYDISINTTEINKKKNLYLFQELGLPFKKRLLIAN